MTDSYADFEDIELLLARLEKGDPSVRDALKASIEKVIAENQQLRGQIESIELELEDARQLADGDVLCPVLNRRAFTREIEREIALADRHGTDLSLLFLDLDQFKRINDRLGHKAGDDALKAFAGALVGGVRRTDIVGRLGGDEFGVLLIGTAGADAETQLERLSIHPVSVLSGWEGLTVSIGLSDWNPGETVEDLLASADSAMFDKKSERHLGGE
mgnify:CR=1 FL=1